MLHTMWADIGLQRKKKRNCKVVGVAVFARMFKLCNCRHFKWANYRVRVSCTTDITRQENELKRQFFVKSLQQ